MGMAPFMALFLYSVLSLIDLELMDGGAFGGKELSALMVEGFAFLFL